jgi:RNA polymerase sigma factor (TIGR02999 family)
LDQDDSLPITRYLRDWKEGDGESAGRVIAGLYAELHHIAENLMMGERPGHTLQPTALINEVYLRLGSGQTPDWRNRAHFFAVVATTLRRILVDHARAHQAERRGGGEERVPLESAEAAAAWNYDDLLAVDEALTQLGHAEPRAARVTELRFFGGLQEREIAEELSVSEITVKRDWKFARAWLAARLKS